MENSYEQQYHDALNKVLDEFNTLQQGYSNTQANGMFNRYHAHGDYEKADVEYMDDLEANNKMKVINHLATIAKLQSGNLDSIAKINQTDSNSMINTVNTASENVDKAMNAVLTMSQHVAGILDALKNEDANTPLAKASRAVSATADYASRQAELALQAAIRANIQASQSISDLVYSEAVEAQTDITTLSKSTQEAYEKSLKNLSESMDLSNSTKTTEMSADEKYLDARCTNDAMLRSIEQVNIISNYSLTLSGIAASDNKDEISAFQVSFNAFNNDPVKTIEYRAFLLKDTEAQGFDYDNAMSVPESNYTKIDPPAKGTSVKNAKLKMVSAKSDEEIVRGQDYVVFVMAVYNSQNFENYLSLPSNKLALTTTLAVATNLSLSFSKPGKGSDTIGSVNFKVTQPTLKFANKKDYVEYRIFLVNEADTDNRLNFNLPLAETLSEGTYIAVKKTSGPIELKLDSTDNYGQPLHSGNSYQAIIMSAFVTVEESEMTEYLSSLSAFSTPATVQLT